MNRRDFIRNAGSLLLIPTFIKIENLMPVIAIAKHDVIWTVSKDNILFRYVVLYNEGTGKILDEWYWNENNI